jgi:competence protein ComEC
MNLSLTEILNSKLRNYPLCRVVLFLSLGIFVGDNLCDYGILLSDPEGFLCDSQQMAESAGSIVLKNGSSISKWFISLCWAVILLPFFIGAWALRSSKGILHLSSKFWFSIAVSFFTLGILMVTIQRQKSLVCWEEEENVHCVQISSNVVEKGKVYQAEAILENGEHKGQKVRLSLMKSTTLPIKGDERLASVESGSVNGMKREDIVRTDSSEEVMRSIPVSFCPNVGDKILCYGRIECPRNAGNPYEFDYAGWLRNQGVTGVLFSAENQWKTVEMPSISSTLAIRMLQFREKLLDQYQQYIDGEGLAVLSAMTLGDKSRLNSKVREVFSQSGTSHVLALSGLHLGILFFFFHTFVLKYCKRRWSIVLFSLLGVFLLWGFAFVAGFPKSLVRATLMFSMMQLCSVFSLRSSSLNNLFFAALCLLLFSPLTLFDVGFQLSCLSVFFILLVMPRLRVPRWVKSCRPFRFVYDLMAVSLCAQLCTAPLVAYYFHTFPTYGILANLLAVPMAYFLLCVSLFFFCLPFLQSFLGIILSMGVDFLLEGLGWISTLPGAVLSWSPSVGTVVGLYALFLLCYAYPTLRRKHFYIGASAVLVFVSAATYYTEWSQRVRPSIVCYNLNKVPAVHFITSPEESYLWSSSPERADSALSMVRDGYWRKCNISSPVWISEQDSLCGEVMKYSDVFSFRGKRLAIVDAPLSAIPPSKPLPVDILLLCRGYKGELAPLLGFYTPSLVVLDGSLTSYYRRKYKQYLQKGGFPTYDARVNGAYIRVME